MQIGGAILLLLACLLWNRTCVLAEEISESAFYPDSERIAALTAEAK